MYNSEKDITKCEWIFNQKTDKKLVASLRSYAGGEVKLSLERYYLKRSDGSWNLTKLGRLTKQEFEWLVSISKDITNRWEER